MFLQYFGLKNCQILQCTIKFYMHLLYIFTVQCKFYRSLLENCLQAFLLYNLQYFVFTVYGTHFMEI